jgi:hypothetical protein
MSMNAMKSFFGIMGRATGVQIGSCTALRSSCVSIYMGNARDLVGIHRFAEQLEELQGEK